MAFGAGVKPKASCLLGKHSTIWTPSQTLRSVLTSTCFQRGSALCSYKKATLSSTGLKCAGRTELANLCFLSWNASLESALTSFNLYPLRYPSSLPPCPLFDSLANWLCPFSSWGPALLTLGKASVPASAHVLWEEKAVQPKWQNWFLVPRNYHVSASLASSIFVS